MIPLSSKKEDCSRVYDKTYSCMFCSNEYPNIARHFFQLHKNEKKILKIKSSNSKDRVEVKLHEKMLGKIRLNGDFLHNMNVLQRGGELKVLQGTGSLDKLTYKDFIPCTHCLGFVQKHELWRHNKTCPY